MKINYRQRAILKPLDSCSFKSKAAMYGGINPEYIAVLFFMILMVLSIRYRQELCATTTTVTISIAL